MDDKAERMKCKISVKVQLMQTNFTKTLRSSKECFIGEI